VWRNKTDPLSNKRTGILDFSVSLGADRMVNSTPSYAKGIWLTACVCVCECVCVCVCECVCAWVVGVGVCVCCFVGWGGGGWGILKGYLLTPLTTRARL